MIVLKIGTFRDGSDKLKLNPETPYNWIFNESNDLMSNEVYLGKGVSASVWRDATDEEYEEWERRQYPEEPDEGTDINV